MAQLCALPVLIANDQNGIIFNGAKLYTYAAGTSSPLATFTDSTGTVANANPVIFDARGQAQVWLSDDTLYKLRLTDASDNLIWEADNVAGVGSGGNGGGTVQASEWLEQAVTPTYISATSFSVPGDLTSTFQQGRRNRAQVTAGVVYSTIDTSVFGGGNTTITLINDSLDLDAGLSAVAVGINSATNPSISTDCIAGLGSLETIATGDVIMHAGSTPRAGYVWCDGTLYDGTDPTYAPLFAVISTLYNTGGEPANNFRVPNLNGRSPMGFGQGNTAEGGGAGTVRSLGDLVGAEEHTLTEAQMPAHVHGPGQGTSIYVNQGTQEPLAGSGMGTTPTTASTGGSGSHNNVSPVAVLGFQIKL